MAIFKTGAIVGGISGTVGGATFVVSSRGLVVRQPRRRTIHRGIFTQIQKGLFQARTRRWATFTPSTRAAWETAARNFPVTNRLGVTNRYTGFILWMHFAANGIFDITTLDIRPPVLLSGPALRITSLNFTVGGPYTFTAETIAPTPYTAITLDAARTWKTTPAKFFRWRMHISSFFPMTGTKTFTQPFDFFLGAPQLGETVAIRVYPSIAGRIPGPRVQLSTTVQP